MSSDNKTKVTTIDSVPDDTPLTGQEDYKYCLISFLSPEGIRNCSLRALKIRGIFRDYEEAKKAAAKVRESDPHFHVYVGEMWKWLPWEPDPETVPDQDYMNDELNRLMQDYKKNREKAKEMYDSRKEDLTSSGRAYNTKQRLREKLEKRKKGETEQKQEPVKEQKEAVPETVETLEKKLKELEEKEKNFKCVKEFLDKQKFDLRTKITNAGKK